MLYNFDTSTFPAISGLLCWTGNQCQGGRKADVDRGRVSFDQTFIHSAVYPLFHFPIADVQPQPLPWNSFRDLWNSDLLQSNSPECRLSDSTPRLQYASHVPWKSARWPAKLLSDILNVIFNYTGRLHTCWMRTHRRTAAVVGPQEAIARW